MNEELKRILSEVLDLPPERIREDAAMENTPGWDSLAQINIILSLEQSFGVSIDPAQAATMTNVAAIRRVLAEQGVAE